MRRLFICCLCLLYRIVCLASPYSDGLIDELNRAIKEAPVYDSIKLHRINKLKTRLTEKSPLHSAEQYDLNLQLYEEYKYYRYDSALIYAKELQRLAGNENEPSLIADARLKAVFIMLTSGMFKETFDSLFMISVKDVSDHVKAEYYSLTGRAYYNLADFNGDPVNTPFYNGKANHYLDSAIKLYPAEGFEYLYYSALKYLKKNNTDSAIYYLNTLIARKDLSFHQIALATSTKGGILMSQGLEEDAKPYLIQASVADIKSSTKETLALLTLAGIIYKEKNTDAAVLYIEKANADATFYNARLRKVQIGAILPLIEGGMITTIKNQTEKLRVFLTALSILVLVLAVLAIIIRKQVIKLKIIRQRLFEANEKQHLINLQLVEANEIKEKYNEQLQANNYQLLEANKIKEEYIGYYFNMDTEFLRKIEKILAAIDKKLTERKWEEIRFILKSLDPKKEKDELLKNFFKVFLKLFPDFVNQFNTLFREEDKIVLKDDQLLSAELRIFALIRLGITENEKIAEILDYSINTIYAKKTKVRSRTIINKDDFEKRLFEITTLGSR